MGRGTTMQAVARARLDERLGKVDTTALAAPNAGWIRAIRDALGMSQRDLAARLAISGPSVHSLEQSEQHGTIGLDTLRRAADALNCDVVYALIPRQSLVSVVDENALAKARALVAAVDHTMALEVQATGSLELQIESTADHIVESGRVWH